MVSPSQYIINNKNSAADSIAQFSQAARTFVPAYNVCPVANNTDNMGRLGGYGSLNTLTAAGCWSPLEIIMNENSLRPVLSSNPLYKNIQYGVGSNSVDTLYGASLPGRGYAYSQNYDLSIDNRANQQLPSSAAQYYQFGPKYTAAAGSGNVNADMTASIMGGQRTSDVMKIRLADNV